MARQWRIQFEGAIYHVMCRGIERGMIFLDEEDYLRFLGYVEKMVEKFQLDIFAFVLMGNHYHFLLRTPLPNLSKAMQWLQTAYSVYYNLKHHRVGHLFQGRYKSILVGEEKYWQSLSFYIHLNPICAGMVKELKDYRWSSYHDYVKLKKVHKWVCNEEILREFGGNKQEQKAKYQQLLMEALGQERKILEEIRYGLVLGSEKFVDWVQKKFVNRESISDELPQQKMLGNDKIVERVLEEIMKEFGVERDRIVKRKRCRHEVARDIGMYLLERYSGLSNKKIGELFGVSHSGVGKAAIRVNEQLRQQKELRKRVENILNSTFKV